MKTSFVSFYKKSLAVLRLSVLTNLEYRINFITDVLIQPTLHCLIEVCLWLAIFKGVESGGLIGHFPKESYLSYALWASFMGRISANWMYEFRLISEVETGTINSLLARPLSFSQFYLFQLLGYKSLTTVFSLLIPLTVELMLPSPTILMRLPTAISLCLFYLIMVHFMSLCLGALAFHLNRVHSFTVAKNLLLWALCGELFPIDLAPLALKEILLLLPFSSGVYLPVAYLTGRIELPAFLMGFRSVAVGIVFFYILSEILWRKGLKQYSGTGA